MKSISRNIIILVVVGAWTLSVQASAGDRGHQTSPEEARVRAVAAARAANAASQAARAAKKTWEAEVHK